MKFFDMHCDIGTDIFEKEKNLKDNHIDRLYDGNIGAVFCACWLRGNEDWATMSAMVKNCHDEIVKNNDKVNFAYSKDSLIDSDKVTCMISCEGMCGITENPSEKVQFLYDNGVRIGSLVWNEQNALAAGWKRDPLYGVTDLGKEVIREMNKRKMIVDVSHINEKGFWDVINTAEMPVIATHSNARELCNHQRNLTDQQIKAIAKKGGVIGLNACGEFVDRDRNKQDTIHLAKHAKYMADLVGIEHIGCGFDFMDFLSNYEDDEMLIDMRCSKETVNMFEALLKEGFSEKEASDIAFYNVYNFLKNNLD